MIKKLAYCLSIFILLGSFKPVMKIKVDLLLLNASIVDIEKGTITKRKLIGIIGDEISLIDEMAQQGNITALKTIDVKNNFIMPGLWDNHVHFRGGEALIKENKNLLPLFLAFGITTVRDAGGDMTTQVLGWRKQIQNGQLDGPYIFTSGPKLDGEKPAWEGSLKVTNTKEVNSALDSLQKIKVDFVKMYDGSLTTASYYQIIKEAKKRGLKTTGHMPLTSDILKGIDLGLNGSEHLYYTLKACSPLGDSLTKLNLNYAVMDQIAASYDPKLAARVYAKMALNHFYVTPTLYIGSILSTIVTINHSQDTLLNYIGKGIQQTYQRRLLSAKKAKLQSPETENKTEKRFKQMILPMYKAGINLMAGSDCGAFNSFTYPGEALHGELFSLVNAGLTPQQALTTSLINGPKFFGLSDSYGGVKKGRKADLLILRKNPLIDIHNLKEMNIVVAKGKVYDTQKIASLLKSIKN